MICIIEDITDIREGLWQMIESDARLEFRGSFADGGIGRRENPAAFS